MVDQAVFPTAPAGIDRAVAWMRRGAAEKPTLSVIEGIGSYRAGLAQAQDS